ncbi:MAG: RNA-binding domain-containing protein [Alkalispirochaeta sp.]
MKHQSGVLNLPISIDDVLRGKAVEWERLEYKSGWNPEAVLRTMCAFANDFQNLGGGYIVIGVAEKDGRPVLPPVGLPPESLDAIQKELLNLGFAAMEPPYHPVAEPCLVDGKTILVIWAPGGETRPYKARVSLSDGNIERAYYIRKQSSTVRARGADERELIGLAATVPFDDRYNQQATVDDLSLDRVREYLREVGSDLAEEVNSLEPEALGRRMNIVGGPRERAFPKNVGLLFFNHDPRQFFPVTQIDVVWFPDGAGGDRFEEKIFTGPLARMTREALDYIRRNYLAETVVKLPDRAEAERFWNFPYPAIEEVVINAVYHRSYQIREPVEVRIGPEDFFVLSFPGPDRSINMDDLRAGRAVSRRYRNRRIGEFLKELDLTEGRSTGIPKILRAMQTNGSPPPEFETDDDRTYYLVRLPVHADTGQPEATQLPTQLPTQSVDSVEKLLLILRNGELSPKELRLRLGLAHRPTFRENYVRPAINAGFIEMTIPDTPTSRNQKYRLTETGRAVLGRHRLGEPKEKPDD